MSWRWLLPLAGVALLVSAGGCDSGTGGSQALSALGAECLINSDCTEPHVCVFERCHEQCRTTRDCAGELRCVGANAPARVCQLESETACRSDPSCPLGLKCGTDGECRDACFTDESCIGDQICERGVCAEPSELDENGRLPQKLELATCRLDLDCDAGMRCAAGNCQPRCRDDRDCLAGELCEAGACRAAEPPCQTSQDCELPGADCRDGVCDCECLEAVDCAAGMLCSECACLPGPNGPCNTSADCEQPHQCLGGQCHYECVDERDCPAGFACEGGACAPVPPATEIADAWIADAVDVEAMRGITRVTGRLHLKGAPLTSSDGLEGLTQVGSLSVADFADSAARPFSGLAGLKVDGNLVLTNLSAALLAPGIDVGGDLVMSGMYNVPCEDIEALIGSLGHLGGEPVFGDNMLCPGL